MEKMDSDCGIRGRGRPVLTIEERSDFNRTKLTLRLKNENCEYVQGLKERGMIDTYSQFFDFLIAGFRQQQK